MTQIFRSVGIASVGKGAFFLHGMLAAVVLSRSNLHAEFQYFI